MSLKDKQVVPTVTRTCKCKVFRRGNTTWYHTRRTTKVVDLGNCNAQGTYSNIKRS